MILLFMMFLNSNCIAILLQSYEEEAECAIPEIREELPMFGILYYNWDIA